MTTDESPEHMEIYDTARRAQAGYVCTVCGALVATVDPYPRAHWDWHRASNGA